MRGACVQKDVDLNDGMREDLGRPQLARDSADAGAPRAGARRHAVMQHTVSCSVCIPVRQGMRHLRMALLPRGGVRTRTR